MTDQNAMAASGFTIGKLWTDDEICGRLYAQACHLDAPALLGDAKDRFFDHLFDGMHKISATKYHLRNYGRIERERSTVAARRFKKAPSQREEEFDLIFELEAFLLQVKSSLDMLAKLVSAVLGDGTVGTSTYGDNGDKLVKGLEQYKKRKSANISAADCLITLIKADKTDWIARVVAWRDTVAHFKAVRGYQFEPVRLPDGRFGVHKPRFMDTDTLEFMRVVYSNNVEFHQEFMCLTLGLRAPGLVLGLTDAQHASKAWGKYGKYVRWGWGFRRPPTTQSDGPAEK